MTSGSQDIQSLVIDIRLRPQPLGEDAWGSTQSVGVANRAMTQFRGYQEGKVKYLMFNGGRQLRLAT